MTYSRAEWYVVANTWSRFQRKVRCPVREMQHFTIVAFHSTPPQGPRPATARMHAYVKLYSVGNISDYY